MQVILAVYYINDVTEVKAFIVLVFWIVRVTICYGDTVLERCIGVRSHTHVSLTCGSPDARYLRSSLRTADICSDCTPG